MEERGTFMIWGGGLMALALVATLLSYVMEKVDHQATTKDALQVEISDNTAALEALRTDLDQANLKYQPLAGRKDLRADCERLLAEKKKRTERITELSSRKESLGKEVVATDAAFISYRRNYLQLIRAAAEGEEVGDLRTLDGREYQGVVLNRVTAEGLEIRHANGVARVPADQLSGPWHQRFQWKEAGALSGVK